MWSLLSKKVQLTLILGAGFASAWAVEALYSFVNSKPPGPLQIVSLAVTIVGGLLVVVADRCWRWVWRRVPVLGTWGFPDLNGTWKGALISTWVNPETGKTPPPIETTITIRQRLFSTHVSQKTGESDSHSTLCFLERFPETRRFRLWYRYDNVPKARVQHRSNPHEGVAYLEFDADKSGSRLAGRYYTARKTSGDIDIRRVRR